MLIGKRIELSINALMESGKSSVSTAWVLRCVSTTNAKQDVATATVLGSVNMESLNSDVATAMGLRSAKIARTGLILDWG